MFIVFLLVLTFFCGGERLNYLWTISACALFSATEFDCRTDGNFYEVNWQSSARGGTKARGSGGYLFSATIFDLCANGILNYDTKFRQNNEPHFYLNKSRNLKQNFVLNVSILI